MKRASPTRKKSAKPAARRLPAKRAKKAVKTKKVAAKKPARKPAQAASIPAPVTTAPTTARRPASPASGRIKVRMYRQGLGDFFLVTLPKADGTPFRMLIDCGVIVGTANAKAVMRDLVTKMKADAGNKLDVVVVTHRHADHVSGFLQAQDLFEDAGLKVGEVWLSWVEDPRDKLGKQLLATHAKAEQALRLGATKLQALGAAAGDEIASLLDFRSEPLAAVAGGSTTTAAVEIAKNLAKKQGASLRFCRPADPPVALDGTGARVFVFGPPPDLKALGKMNPSSTHPETYGIAASVENFSMALGLDEDTDEGGGVPFADTWSLPLDPQKAPEFIRGTYFDQCADWQRIDSDWLEGASALALAFDQAVNNTSLVLAIELDDGGDVLLFAADAQVGNWLTWGALKWTLPGGTVTAPDLLKRTIFYKVGHHASHNATLEAQGLELMEKITFAMISVNADMALKKKWGRMPFEPLLTALNQHTANRTIRSDKPIPPAAQGKVTGNNDYYELTL